MQRRPSWAKNVSIWSMQENAPFSEASDDDDDEQFWTRGSREGGNGYILPNAAISTNRFELYLLKV